MAHITGQSRYQRTLFPESLDEMIPSDHPVRVIDAFVDKLDLKALGFEKAVAKGTGRPPYLPSDLLKLYLYGYLNRVRSSRLLEQETKRNIEVLWLLNRLTPTYKTIADFRKEHPQAIVNVCRELIYFCRGQQLFGAELLAIDGTKLQAVASRKQVITPQKLQKQITAVERKIAHYLTTMDDADQQEPTVEASCAEVQTMLKALQEEHKQLQQEKQAMEDKGIKQKVATETDAKLMRTPNHGYQVAYNAQTVVDAKHKLILAFDLTNHGNDHQQLQPMAAQGKDTLAVEQITIVADSGYSNGKQGQQCAQAHIIAIVPRARTINPEGEKFFSRDRFTYDPESDTWQCPAHQTLTCRKVSHTQENKAYSSHACGSCAQKSQCTKATQRVILRSFYEDAREAMHQRANSDPKWMMQRKSIVEHPFGTIKWLMGYPRFLVRGLKKAKAEMALVVLSYNLKRVMNILSVPELLKAL